MKDLFGDIVPVRGKFRQGHNKGKTYEQFVGKFKSNPTTDDCYTPENVYQAILDWVKRRAGIGDGVRIMRPFRPGGDYLSEDCSGDCAVIDNPPFSIISKICYNYDRLGVKYFLFAPYLTLFNVGRNCRQITHIVSDADILYANGAKIPTSFVSNLFGDDKIIISAGLTDAIKQANGSNRKAYRVPRYVYPRNVISAALTGGLSDSAELVIHSGECRRIEAGTLDDQRKTKKKIFGAGFFVSDKTAERIAAERIAAGKQDVKVWQLSDREKQIIEELNGNDTKTNI
jgi:hypothetical protein